MAATYYDLSTDDGRRRFIKRANREYNRQSYVKIEVADKQRSLPQNSYLHVCIGIVAVELGESRDYVKQYYYKRLCNSDLYVSSQYDTFFGGEIITAVRSTRDLSTEEMALSIDRFKNWAAQQGIFIPDPDDGEACAQAKEFIRNNEQYNFN